VRIVRAGTVAGTRQTDIADRRLALGSPPTAAALGVLIVLLAAAVIPLTVLAHQPVAGNAAQLLVGVPMGVVGFIVARRQPRNPIGWLLLVVVVGILLSLVADSYAWLVYRLGYRLPFGPLAAFLETAYFPVLVVVLPPVFLLFPDGVLPSPRWRWVLRSYLAVAVILMGGLYVALIIGMAIAGVHIDASGNLSVMDHPPVGMAWAIKYAGLILFPMLAFWLVFAGRLALSWRRASGDRRQQLKWLLCGVVVAVAGLVISNVVPALDPAATAVGVGVVLPVCLGVAILKYRLYDIDRIISRTVAYALVTGVLAGVYAGLVLLATKVLSVHSTVAVAAATLAAAALFNPLRRQVQKVVDRRFNRARYDADRIIAGFAARLQDAVDLDAVRADLASSVQKALEPAHISMWIRASGKR
jgi:MFS family permease